MKKVYLQDNNILSPLGFTTAANFDAVFAGETSIKEHSIHPKLGSSYVSMFDQDQLAIFFNQLGINNDSSRIEKLAIAALKPLIDRKTPGRKSLLVVSTTKGNIKALADSDEIDTYIPSLAKHIAKYFGFDTEPLTLSNACVSGLMALSLAKRYIQMGMFDDAYIVAFDEVSAFVQSGFQSFQAISTEACRPYDKLRKGVSLGEAATACYISTEENNDSIQIAADSSINDANHISGPSRTGEGLFLSIQKAMQEAAISADQIDYIVGHGTATLYNDEMEAIAFNRAGLGNTPLASYKGNYGHTLAASGLLECILMATCLRQDTLLASKGFESLGTSEYINVLVNNMEAPIRTALKTASGFGGTNTALLLMKG